MEIHVRHNFRSKIPPGYDPFGGEAGRLPSTTNEPKHSFMLCGKHTADLNPKTERWILASQDVRATCEKCQFARQEVA